MGSPVRPFTLLAFGVPTLLAVGLACMGFDGLYGQDAYGYLRQALAFPGPAGSGTTFPEGYPAIVAILGRAIGGPLIAARCVSVLSHAAVAWILFTLLGRAFPAADRKALACHAVCSVSLSPFLLRSSQVVMADAWCLFLLMAAFACLLRVREVPGPKWVFATTVALAGACWARYAAAPLALVFAAALVRYAVRSSKAKALWPLLLTAIVLAVLVPREAVHAALEHPWLREWSPVNAFRRRFVTADGLAQYTLPNVFHVAKVLVHPGFLTLGPLLLPFVRRADLRLPIVRLAVCGAAVYLVFLMGPPYQNDRFLLLAQPFLALALFPAFLRLHARLVALGRKPVRLLGAVAVLQLVLLVPAMRGYLRHNAVERRIAQAVNERPERVVYAFAVSGALRVRCADRSVHELWGAPVEHFEAGALVVFNPTEFARQWEGMDPMLNWQRALDRGAAPVMDWPDGWIIARLPGP